MNIKFKEIAIQLFKDAHKKSIDEVIADKNICYNDDGQIFTKSNYIYEFEDISEMGCIGTCNIINDIIGCIRNSEIEEA